MEELFKIHPIMIYVGFFALLSILLTFADIIYDYFLKKNRDWKDTWSNMVTAVFKELFWKTFVGTIWIIFLYLISSGISWEIPMNIFTWILSFILADFTYYWMHRTEHEHSILWGFHSVHHSSESYNMSTANRLSWFEDLIEWIFLIPMILIWFNVFQIIISLVLVVIYQHFLHTEKIKKLWFLEYILNTPSHHRVHHASNRGYINKNYSWVFNNWDKLFWTFAEEGVKVKYWLTKNINTYNPFLINIIEFKNIYANVKKCKNLSDKIKIIFGKTGWKPYYLYKEYQWKEQNKNKKQQKNYF